MDKSDITPEQEALAIVTGIILACAVAVLATVAFERMSKPAEQPPVLIPISQGDLDKSAQIDSLATGISSMDRWDRLITEATLGKSRIPPLFIKAIIRVESDFKAEAISRDEDGQPVAIGLMQILPTTSLEVGGPDDPRILMEPHVNIQVGVSYLNFLEKRLRNALPQDTDARTRLLVIAAAYRCGPTHLDSVLAGQVPLAEKGVQYVQKIWQAYGIFQSQSLKDSAWEGEDQPEL